MDIAPLCAAALALCIAASTALAQDAAPAAAPVAPAAAAAPGGTPGPRVTLRAGEHADYTRLVFDFSQLTAYTATRDKETLVLTFDTSANVALPALRFHLIENMEAAKPDGGTLRVVIKLAGGASARDYRLNNKVLVDIYSAAKLAAPKIAAAHTSKKKHAPAAKAEETKVAAAAPKTPVPAAAPETPAPAAAPEDKPAEKAANAVAAANPNIVVDKAPAPAPAMPSAPVTAVEQEPTKISISTVEPTRLAVFPRFDTLWVVMDSEAAGAVAPEVSGPEAGLLGSAETVKFKGGTAYRFTLPPKRYLSVVKHSLTWEVYVSSTQQQSPSNTTVNVSYDESTHTAKLMTELQDASNPLEIQDPSVGDTLYVVATPQQDERIDQSHRFPEVEVLPAAIGMAIRPLADDIHVNRIENFVMVTAPNGIDATPDAIKETSGSADDPNATRLFDFPSWRKGGIPRLYGNVRLLEDKAAAATKPEERQDLLMQLALLYFSNNFGQEALGVLTLIEQENPDMDKNPNFIAVRGAASAMAGHYQEALKDLQHPLLQQNPEVSLWIGYAAAASEQWRMANRSFPSSNRLLLQYPDNISVPFTIYMAESALRLGHTEAANNLLSTLDSMSGSMDSHYEAAVQYLKGEAAHQMGKDEDAIKLWDHVAFGLDRLYHTKASLALANINLKDKKITLKDAIDIVDSLRFAWRGDGLEVQILENLGALKVQNKQFLSGLEDMKKAAALSDEILDDSQPIKDDMSKIFSNVFVGGQLKDIPPLETVSIYNEFNSLMPSGPDASIATLNFADSLISIDLLDKAEKIFEDEIKGGQMPQAKMPAVGAKLATIYLLDNSPDKALTALQATGGTESGDAQVREERGLLKARALSQLNRTDEAIALLSQVGSKDALHLKADVLWHAKRWDQAAEAIEALLPAAGKPLSDDDAQMVVNSAVAYKLAKDDANVARIKSTYSEAMQPTKLWPTFSVVTRTSTGSELSDAQTLLHITGEVDMFKGFLDNYKAGTSN